MKQHEEVDVFTFFRPKISADTLILVTCLSGTLKGLVVPIMPIVECVYDVLQKDMVVIVILEKSIRFWHSVTFVRSLLLKSLHLIWHLNPPQMLHDFMFLINVNPQVAVRVVWFPCQSPDWENYAGNEEMMMPIKVSNSSLKLTKIWVCSCATLKVVFC